MIYYCQSNCNWLAVRVTVIDCQSSYDLIIKVTVDRHFMSVDCHLFGWLSRWLWLIVKVAMIDWLWNLKAPYFSMWRFLYDVLMMAVP